MILVSFCVEGVSRNRSGRFMYKCPKPFMGLFKRWKSQKN